MSKAIFQVLGGFVLALAVILLGGGVFTAMRYPPPSVWDFVRPTIIIVILVVAGIGLFYLRKWAALAVSLLAL